MSNLSDTPHRKPNFLDDVRELMAAERKAGMAAREIAYLLTECSNEAAMEGGPVSFYAHSRFLVDYGLTRLDEIEERLGDRVDMEALARGELLIKNT